MWLQILVYFMAGGASWLWFTRWKLSNIRRHEAVFLIIIMVPGWPVMLPAAVLATLANNRQERPRL